MLFSHGRNIYTEIDLEKDGIVPIESSISSMTSSNYFESIIENCIQFFNEDYFFKYSASEMYEIELQRILDNPQATNNIGKLILIMYNHMRNKGKNEKSIRSFIYRNFFDNSGLDHSLYQRKKRDIEILFKRFGIDNNRYRDLEKVINYVITGDNYDFSDIGIDCTVYRNPAFDIKPSELYQVAMSYNAIILTHNIPNNKYWEINPITIDGRTYTDLEWCLDIMTEKKILVLSCNDDGNKITCSRPGVEVVYPKHSLISELYIES